MLAVEHITRYSWQVSDFISRINLERSYHWLQHFIPHSSQKTAYNICDKIVQLQLARNIVAFQITERIRFVARHFWKSMSFFYSLQKWNFAARVLAIPATCMHHAQLCMQLAMQQYCAASWKFCSFVRFATPRGSFRKFLLLFCWKKIQKWS